MMEDDLWWKTTYDGRRLMIEDDLWWKTTYDGRRLMMKEDNEDDLKNKEDLHRWKAHGAGHIPLCGIFF